MPQGYSIMSPCYPFNIRSKGQKVKATGSESAKTYWSLSSLQIRRKQPKTTSTIFYLRTRQTSTETYNILQSICNQVKNKWQFLVKEITDTMRDFCESL